jgi:alpha-glucosidase
VLQFRRGDVVVCVNLGAEPFPLPAGEVLLSSEPVGDGALPSDAAAWVRE